MNQIRTKLKEFRKSIIKQITAYLEKTSERVIYTIDLNEAYSPVLEESHDDDELTYTLDRIYLENGVPTFGGSSAVACSTWRYDQVSVEVLCDILEYLEKYQDNI